MDPFLIDKVELEAFVLVHHHLVHHRSDQVTIESVHTFQLLEKLQVMLGPFTFVL